MTRKCKYCIEPLPDLATYCKECGHYQVKWKNWLPHLGGGIALLAILASIFTYLFTPLRVAYETATWRDRISVVSFNSIEGVTVKNSGDGDVYLESVTYRDPKIIESGSFPIFTTAAKGKFTSYRFKIDKKGKVIEKGGNYDKSKIKAVFLAHNDPAYRYFKRELGDALLTFECEAELRYFSLVKELPLRTRIPCIGIYIEK